MELGIECTKLVPDNIDYFIDVLILNSDDHILAVTQFLSLLDDIIDYLPEWIAFEITGWKDLFIEMFSYKTFRNISFINEVDLFNKITETEFEYLLLFTDYQNEVFSNFNPLIAMEKELDSLYYQVAIIERIKKSNPDSGNNEIFLNSLTRKTEKINMAYAVY
jgi:hypothetical protein